MSSSEGQEAPNGSVTYIVPVPPQVDEELVTLLKNMLSYAEAGELIGIVAFCQHTGQEIAHASSPIVLGNVDFAKVLVAFEDWKFKQLWRRNRTDEP